MFHHRPYIFAFLSLLLSFSVCAQKIAPLETLMNAGKYDDAATLLYKQVNGLIAVRNFDSLCSYVFYVGNISLKRKGEEPSVKEVKDFIGLARKSGASQRDIRHMYLFASEYYSSIGKNTLGYQANEDALKITLALPDATPGELGRVENNLATMAMRMGETDLSRQHSRKALNYLESRANDDLEALFTCYNGIASAHWFAYKLDSAADYFNRALVALSKCAPNPLNRYYRVAVVQNNLSAIYGVQGRVTEAINAMKSCINNLNTFQAHTEWQPKQKEAVLFKLEATDNLAGIYKDLGDYARAEELLQHSFREKQQKLNASNPAIFVSQILLGQLFLAMRQFDKSEQYLLLGLKGIEKSDGDYLIWKADGDYAMALLYDERKQSDKASQYFELANSIYEESSRGEYDNIYLEFLQNEALFYSESGSPARGLAIAKHAYDYVVKTEAEGSLMRFHHLLNLSEVSYNGGQYKQARDYSIEGMRVLDEVMHTSTLLLDSIKMEIKKPKAILLESKAEYQLLKVKDVKSLTVLLDKLKSALALLERRKSIIHDAGDIGLMITDQAELLKFTKQITLELYRLTNDPAYGEALIDLHESGIYNRIRARLDLNDSLRFSNVPLAVLRQEKRLKDELVAALNSDRGVEDRMSGYFTALDNSTRFQQALKKDYPQYYQMRYQSIFRSLDSVFSQLPAGVTLIRYFYVDKELLAMAGDRSRKQIVNLDATGLNELISSISAASTTGVKTGETLYQLYNKLWAPLASMVKFNKIVIVPDGMLFNLNFELLTPEQISSYEELATGTLLAKYTISYNYSLFLINQHQARSRTRDNFVGFAPGFSDDIKQEYRRSSRDSQQLDNSYLSLLPQPFTVGLADKTRDLLGGSLFINERSTASSFKQHAGEHRIIHIGTHAESNNLHPEFSRLIFAKDTGMDAENSVYLYDLYNCDLRSDLTVLTACESGKPGYMDGEGMISLAHAFNYAGSESMLTGLWKIDEQASAVLMDYFYRNIKQGMDKDEALRQAKLSYLRQAKGRTLAPVYWAGLVLMGNTEPVVFEGEGLMQHRVWWVAGLIMVFALAGFIFWKRRKAAA